MNSNSAQLWSAVRSLAQVVLGVLIGRGLISAEQAATLINDLMVVLPALASLGVLAYGFWKRSNTNLVKTKSTVVPGVEVRVDPMSAPAAVIDVANDRVDPAAQNVNLN